eukprot:COSAG01_NODE_18285_length_1086_cov_26.903749_2_plen_28_part_01
MRRTLDNAGVRASLLLLPLDVFRDRQRL